MSRLVTRSIAVSSVIGGILDPFESRLDKLAGTYDRDLFKGARLSALRAGRRLQPGKSGCRIVCVSSCVSSAAT